MVKDVYEITIKKGDPAYCQIVDNLRKKIQSQAIPLDTRMHTIDPLSKKWNINYFTVKYAQVIHANEVLNESTPRSETYVRS